MGSQFHLYHDNRNNERRFLQQPPTLDGRRDRIVHGTIFVGIRHRVGQRCHLRHESSDLATSGLCPHNHVGCAGHLRALHGRNNPELSLTDGANNLSSGAAVGLSCLASGIGMALFIGRINDGSATASPKTESVVNSFDDEPLLSVSTNTEEAGAYSNESCRKIFFTSCFLVAIGWYGLIVAVLLVN